MSRENQYSVSVSLDGVPIPDSWDKLEGGGKDSEETKYKPGGMAPEVSLGGSTTIENLTVSRLYRLARDHGLIKTFFNRAGKGQIVITKQPLDIDGNVFGAPLVYNGTLKTVTPPDFDSESDDASLWSIEVTPYGNIA